MLANELYRYKERENFYVNDNIWEIQELYKEEKIKKEEEKIEDEEVIFIKPYEIDSSSSSSTQSSGFINKKTNNLLKYMKFVKSPIQTRIFRPPPYYQLLWSRGKQDSNFWKDLFSTKAIATYNTETSRNGYSINMFQGESPH